MRSTKRQHFTTTENAEKERKNFLSFIIGNKETYYIFIRRKKRKIKEHKFKITARLKDKGKCVGGYAGKYFAKK